MTLLTSRRSFIARALGLLAAPAIVRVENIMPIRVWSAAHTNEDWFMTASGFIKGCDLFARNDGGIVRYQWRSQSPTLLSIGGAVEGWSKSQ